LATGAAFRAADIFFFAGAFFTAAFSALCTAAQRFFVAATIAARPAALSFRLAFGAAAEANGPAAFFDLAHRFRCASPMRFLAAALIFRRLRVAGSGVLAALSVGPPDKSARSSAILESILDR
jgi:hypothetical protein